MYIKSTFAYTKKGTNLKRTIMIKNGILIKFSALEEHSPAMMQRYYGAKIRYFLTIKEVYS